MQPNRTPGARIVALLLAALLVAACSRAARSDAVRRIAPHLTVTNATYDSIVALGMAEDGNGDFHDIALQEPLQGGMDTVTVDVPAGRCLREVRVRFGNGRVMHIPHLDLCRAHHLRLTTGMR